MKAAIKTNLDRNMALHFYTLVPAMRNHLSFKTIFCGPVRVVLLQRFHCISIFKRLALIQAIDNFSMLRSHHLSQRLKVICCTTVCRSAFLYMLFKRLALIQAEK